MKYREIEFGFGSSIESAVKELKGHSDLVCGSFNGEMLYSDVDDLDSAYKKITGKTKLEYKKDQQKRQDDYEQKKREHEEAIPDLTEEWIKKGNEVLDKRYHDLWAKVVPVRLKELYRGYELEACLDIVDLLNNGHGLDDAKDMIEQQGHSGMSFSLVCSIVNAFCIRGSEFVNYVES